jgi:hypothetical protein
MAEDKAGIDSILENLALITDGVQALFPTSKSVLIYELNSGDFTYVKSHFKNIKIDENQIKIDISGTEVIFILENSYKQEQIKEEEPVQVKTKWEKIKLFFTTKSGEPTVKG